jgi:hypothetical protein
VPLVEQELPILPEHLSSPLVFTWVRVTRSLVLCVCFVDSCCHFSFGHCASSIYGFWLHLLFLQTLLVFLSSGKSNEDLKHKLSKWNKTSVSNIVLFNYEEQELPSSDCLDRKCDHCHVNKLLDNIFLYCHDCIFKMLSI